jgi:hypothetical protein
VSAATGSRSFWKMLVTCFSTPRSVRKSCPAIAEVREPFGHQSEHLALARAQVADRVVATATAHEMRDDARIECGAALAVLPQARHFVPKLRMNPSAIRSH